MKITWIGQAGLLFESGKTTVIIDPYLSDSVREINPDNFRHMPVNEEFFKIRPNVIIFTHNHLDHYDPQTVKKFITKDSGITVLAPQSVWSEVKKYGGNNNYVLFNRHTEWTIDDFKFTAVLAVHSDITPIGVIIEAENKKYYITGDTLYNSEIFADIPKNVEAIFLPINGIGNNMNCTDAARFAGKIQAKYVVPIHFGMFDDIDVKKEFLCKNRVIPQIYEEVTL